MCTFVQMKKKNMQMYGLHINTVPDLNNECPNIYLETPKVWWPRPLHMKGDEQMPNMMKLNR